MHSHHHCSLVRLPQDTHLHLSLETCIGIPAVNCLLYYWSASKRVLHLCCKYMVECHRKGLIDNCHLPLCRKWEPAIHSTLAVVAVACQLSKLAARLYCLQRLLPLLGNCRCSAVENSRYPGVACIKPVHKYKEECRQWQLLILNHHPIHYKGMAVHD